MTENDAETQVRKPPEALFLETSAQILRLVGSSEMRHGINQLMDATPKPKIGTSACVKREFEHTYLALFHKIEQAAASLPKRGPLPFEELWLEIQELLGPYYAGGPNFLFFIFREMSAVLRHELVTPNRVLNVLGGLKEKLALRFVEGELFDKSSCGVWESRGSCPCDPGPGADCKLKDIGVANRANFLATAATLAQAKREESRHILKILERLQAAEGKPLLELLGKHRAHVGDLIIFWEVPDGWTILSRDRTFEILKDKYRAGIDFYMVRLPRYASGHACMVRRDGIAEDVEGVLMNYNARGARVQAPIVVSERQKITIEAQEIASRVGEVSKFKNEAERKSQPSFGLKFKSSQRRT